ncbi:MAG: Permease [Frankiales bacterium]|nr:Permease [Frankiales bacterium]
MRCDAAREGLSARLDGEDPQVPAGELDRHVAACPGCADWSAAAAGATRPLRVAAAPTAVDLTDGVLQALRERPAPRTEHGLARRGLVVVALAHLLLSLPDLLFGSGHEGVHVARELGATDVALAIGVLAAAWRPWRAAGMLPVVAALSAGLAGTSLLDLLAHETTPLRELPHLLAVAETLLLVRLRRHGSPAPDTAHRPALRRVA